MPMQDSRVTVVTGGKGQGKTLLMTAYGMDFLSKGGKVWANYKIEGSWHKKFYQALPLDMNALYSFSEDIVNGLVIIDEMQYFADSRFSQSLTNTLLNYIIMQIRKRDLNLIYSVKFFPWADKRIRLETDVEITTQDMSFFPHDDDVEGSNRGERFLLKFRDLSGAMTGVSYYSSGQEYEWVFQGKRFHKYYNTKDTISVFDAMRPVTIDWGPRKIISLFGGPQEEGELIPPVPSSPTLEDNRAVGLVQELKQQGRKRITLKEFWQIHGGDPKQDGRGISLLGVTKHRGTDGNAFYKLS